MSTKVFVGNLSFKIQPDKLRDEFSAAGNVLSANIITRGPRSLGYGFVEFASREEAEKSVTLLNQKDIDGRQINVEVAKPRAEVPEKEKRQDNTEGGQRPPKRTRRPKNPNTNTGGNNSNVQGGPPPQRTRGPQHQGQGQGQSDAPRKMYKPRYQNQDNAGGHLANEGQGNVGGGRNFNNFNNNQNFANNNTGEANNRGFRRRRRNNPNRGPRQDLGGVPQQPNQQQPQQQPPQFRRKRPPPQPRKQQERVSSPTTLFVANLPFSVDDKELAEIFSAKWKVASAHVVKKRNTRSKGFGFVEFENEADQQAALKEFDGFTLHERVLNVKVALTAVPGQEGEDQAAPASGEKTEGAEKTPEKAAATEEPKAEAKETKAETPAATAEGTEEKKGGQ